MNCEHAQRSLLLADSGELRAAGRRKLERHLAACASCREYRRLLHAAARRAPGPPPGSRDGEERVRRVLRAAGAAEAGRIVRFPSPLLRAAACAAGLALVVGGWLLVSGPKERDRVAEMHAVLAIVGEAEPRLEADAEHDGEERLRALAEQLLLMEGLHPDGVMAEEFAEPTPRSLQSHSSGALPAGRCA
jgi:hypothetical protein